MASEEMRIAWKKASAKYRAEKKAKMAENADLKERVATLEEELWQMRARLEEAHFMVQHNAFSAFDLAEDRCQFVEHRLATGKRSQQEKEALAAENDHLRRQLRY
ncbi:hypothetical protein QR680_012355 [Steinernema hermaphroditum]|uniref:Uncharacterized protein n=1 Tax=Steinernema hermaphroditum TaxID=289476 RepID=A0AA39M0D6_9BILA|nr:hypothetical protein QR680_012355 [Steinernema hermaphroditum]